MLLISTTFLQSIVLVLDVYRHFYYITSLFNTLFKIFLETDDNVLIFVK